MSKRSESKKQMISLRVALPNSTQKEMPKEREIFFKHEVNYEAFPRVDKKITIIINFVNKYLNLVGHKEDSGTQKIKDIVLNMMKNSSTLDVFYFGFLKYLSGTFKAEDDDILNDTYLFESLVQSIAEMADFCSERDMAATIGYFLDILNLGVYQEEKDYESVSAYSIKRNILDICKKNILNNAYFVPYMLYEIALRESEWYKKEKYFNYCLHFMDENKLNECENINPLIKKTNEAYMLDIKIDIFFELIKKYYKKDPLGQFETYLKNVKDLMLDLSKVPTSDISFDLYCKNHDFIISAIEKDISDFDLDGLDKLDAESLLKKLMILNTYASILKSIVEQCNYFESVRTNLSFGYDSDVAVQGLSTWSALEAMMNKALNRVKEACDLNIPVLDIVVKKTREMIARATILNSRISSFIGLINKPYYPAIKKYITDSVPEDFSNEFIDKGHSKENEILFSLKLCRDTSKLIKKYDNMLTFKEGILTLDLKSAELSIAIINEIAQKIYRIKKWMVDRELHQKLEILNKEKLARPQIGITSSESKKEIVEISDKVSKFVLEEENEKTVEPTIKRNVRVCSKYRYKKNNDVIKNEETSKNKEFLKVNKHSKIFQEAIRMLEPTNDINPNDLIEAKNYTLNFVLNANTKQLIMVAINKKLIDQSGKAIAPQAQEKINNMAKNIRFIKKFGQDGIKPYSHILKARYAGDTSYRATPSEILSVGNRASLIVYNEVINKNNTKRRGYK